MTAEERYNPHSRELYRKAGITVTQTVDAYDTPCYIVSRKKGKLTRQAVYEAMESAELFGVYLMDFNISEDAPGSLYDDGDSWGLYDPDVLLGQKAEDVYNRGYDDCYRVECPEGEWMQWGAMVKCNCCGGSAPRHPDTSDLWRSPVCPHCGARMKNADSE